MLNVDTSAVITVSTDYPYSADQPAFYLGTRELGYLGREADGTQSLYTPNHLAMGMLTYCELSDTDLMGALAHLMPRAEEILADDREYEASLQRYRADRLARGLAPNQW
jgi:hypothetical protein